MPIREFKCTNGHTTEHILPLSDERTLIVCRQPNTSGDHAPSICGSWAYRVEISLPAPAQFIAGVGGFHKASISKNGINANEKVLSQIESVTP